MSSSNYRIEQGFKYQGDDWWKWWIWLEGSTSDLDAVKHVIYTLHSTFRNPVQTVSDRKSKFKLATEGWGIFTIYATVVLKNGGQIRLTHDLHLEYSDGTRNLR